MNEELRKAAERLLHTWDNDEDEFSVKIDGDIEALRAALDKEPIKDAFKAGLEAAAKVCDSMKYADRLTKEACAKYIRKLADEA